MRRDNTTVVTEDIRPLLDEVQRICRMHSIPWSALIEMNAHTGECLAVGYIPPDRKDAPSDIVNVLEMLAQTTR